MYFSFTNRYCNSGYCRTNRYCRKRGYGCRKGCCRRRRRFRRRFN